MLIIQYYSYYYYNMTKHQQHSCNDERGISLQNDWYPFKNQLNYTSINCSQIPMIFHTFNFWSYFVDSLQTI